MRWVNKGHEYDAIGSSFVGKKIFIYGAGENGRDLLDKLSFLDCVEGFIDNDEDKIQKGFCGKSVVDVQRGICIDKAKYIIVVAASLENSFILQRQLLMNGFEEGKNLFDYHTFCDFYLPIYVLYAYNKVYFPSISLITTTWCNLDCVGCLSFTHYNRNRKHYTIEAIAESLKALFKHVDYIGLFHLSGGEPFLHPQIKEIVSFIHNNYGNKIGTLGITTNGTYIPDEELCKVLSETEALVWVDDYTENVELARKRFDTVIHTLEQTSVNFKINSVDSWIKLESEKKDEDEEQTYLKACVCNVPFLTIKGAKIYGCNYCEYAHEAGLNDEYCKDDYINLEEYTKGKKILLEYSMGFSESGFYSFCKKCKGFTNRRELIPVAEQFDKKRIGYGKEENN